MGKLKKLLIDIRSSLWFLPTLLAGGGGGEWHAVPSSETGYVQTLDVETLLSFARERGVALRVERGVGEFTPAGKPIVSVSSPAGHKDVKALNAAFAVGRYRTAERDPVCGVRQLVDIALKALSPGINDTTTAVTCVDYLGVILARLARRNVPAGRDLEKIEDRAGPRGKPFRPAKTTPPEAGVEVASPPHTLSAARSSKSIVSMS